MKSLNKQKRIALLKAGVGIATRDKQKALDGMSEFVHLGILEMEMQRMSDEAELYMANEPDYETEA